LSETKTEAVFAGFFESALKMEGGTSEKFPKIQILTIAGLLDGRKQSNAKAQRVGLF
jgi:hypothetical protein